MRRKWIFLAPLAILAIPVIAFIGGEIVKQLWNWLLPPLFGWPQVTFGQALGPLGLCRMLFGGIGRHGSAAPIAAGAPRARNARPCPTLRLWPVQTRQEV